MELLRNKTILVVAEDPENREMVADEFRRAGSQVFLFSGGLEAFEVARISHVDAVVCAARLAGGDPTRLLLDIQRLNRDIPVILFGAAGGGLSQTEATHQGFAAYFPQILPASLLAEAAVRSLRFVEERKKRKAERVVVAAQAELSFGEPCTTMNLPVLNVSQGGMFLSLVPGFPPAHTSLSFRLSLPQEPPAPAVEGKAVVRWVRENPGKGLLAGIGLEFTEISSEAQLFLQRYVERLSRR